MDDLRVVLPWATMLMATFSGTAVSQQFRIDTEVFVADHKEPVSESLTIFSGEVVYDFLLGDVKETTMFDIRRGRLVLLDPQRKVQTSLTTDNLLEFNTELKSRATEKLKALFEPHFQVQFDEANHQLTLTSEAITYRAKGIIPREPEAAKRYQQFADWYARLNALRPENLPPFARLELNKALAERNLVPAEIERTVIIKGVVVEKKKTARSVHSVNWLISNSDRSRIEVVGTQLTTFKHVPLAEFWQTGEQAKAK